jgi:hypothetical protein
LHWQGDPVQVYQRFSSKLLIMQNQQQLLAMTGNAVNRIIASLDYS